MPTTTYNAGIDSSDLVFSYGKEVTWGTKPAIQFQAIRLLGESLAASKTRTRPQEINSLGYASHGLTTQVQAAGDVNYALSFGTYDALFEGLLNGTWSTPLSITSATTDISFVVSTNKITSTNASKFTSIVVGQWIFVAGATNQVNNGWHRVITKTNNQDITVATTLTNETSSGTNITIVGTMLRNGTDFWSYYLQKKLATSLFLTYAGSYISGGSLSASVGDFMQGSFSFMSKNETNETTDQSTGAVLAANTYPVLDTVSHFQALQMDNATLSGTLQGITINLTKNNARAQYGIGSSSAAGMGKGTIQVDGTVSIYFTNFTLYDKYKNETDVSLSFRAVDPGGRSYVITLPQVTLINPSIQAGGPDTDVLANFNFEASQHSTFGATIQIDKQGT